MLVDTTFAFRTDARTDDPDQSSPTLRRYHQLLWSKPLPSGQAFHLDVTTAWTYLHHSSDIGEYFLSSDSVIATYSYWQSMAGLMHQLPKIDVERFEANRAATLCGSIEQVFEHFQEVRVVWW